jgi:hypothetical protein
MALCEYLSTPSPRMTCLNPPWQWLQGGYGVVSPGIQKMVRIYIFGVVLTVAERDPAVRWMLTADRRAMIVVQ